MDSPTEHKCNIKGKLAALAQEIKLWEDDVRHLPTAHKLECKPAFKKPVPSLHIRESLANLDIIPVATMKARFESMSNADGRENDDPIKYLKPPLMNSKTKSAPFFSPLTKCSLTSSRSACPVVVDVPRGSVSHAERSRLERMNELARLRQRSAAMPHDLPPPPNVDSVDESPPDQQSLQIVDAAVYAYSPVVDTDYTLPPPPINADTTDIGNTIGDASLTPPCSPVASHDDKVATEVAAVGQPCPEATTNSPTMATLPGSQQSPEDFFLPSGLEDGSLADDSASSTDGSSTKHTYYSRPPFSTKRRHDAVDATLPRQRSVTFLPARGAAPGDTTSEGSAFDVESEVGSTDTECHSSRPVYATDSLDSAPSYREKHAVDEETIDSLSSTSETSNQLPTLTSVRHSKRSSSSSISDAHRRRLERLTQLPVLLEAERHVILQASAALQHCAAHTSTTAAAVNPDGAAGIGSLGVLAMTPKRSRPLSSQTDSWSAAGSQLGPGSVAHVEASRMLLVACQRRQVLMEELTLLENNSPVLVPPSRGEPIRARLNLSAVRLGLKTVRKPGTNTDGNDASGGGFVVVSQDTVSSATGRYGLTGAPLRYHLIAIIKCRGEGRMFQSGTVTLMHLNDLPVGTARPADYVDLPANIEIIPLRPDFTFTLEVYCLTVGSDSVRSLRSCQSPQFNLLNTPECARSAPRSSRHNRGLVTSPTTKLLRPPSGTPLTRSSKKVLQHLTESGRLQPARRRLDIGCKSSVLSACLMPPSMSPLGSSSIACKASDIDYTHPGISASGSKMAAFTLLSSVDMHYHDDLLVGRFRAPNSTALTKDTPSSSTVSDQMPLRLTRLPRSSPLTGLAGLVNASVGLEARIMNRGFITVFEEVGGLGIWRRYWCQLRADHLQFWRYPEDEQRSPGRRRSSSSEQPPVCRIDLRHVVAPRAIPAPHHVCARTNSIYMRSIKPIEPDCLSASINAVASQVRSKKASGVGAVSSCSSSESLIFRASPDHAWLEQKHLLCADTLAERDRWIQLLNTSMSALKRWMPEHFSCLSSLDAKLDFCQPVSSNLAALLIRGGVRGTDSTA